MSTQILEIARSGLAATRRAIELGAQNVANAQTPGYIRQRVSLAPIALADPCGGVGLGNGVTVQTIQRLRNQCLEAQINHQEGQLGYQQARLASLSRLEATFTDLNSDGVTQALGAFFDSLEKLQAAPGSTGARDEVLFAADTIGLRMRQTASQFVQEQATLADELQQHVAEVNRLLHEVADLNGKIMPLGDNPQANDLRVAREQAIRELAGLCGVMGLDQDNNAQDVLLGGIRLVQGTAVTELALVPDPSQPARQMVVAGDLGEPDTLGGEIAGCLTARDQYADWQQAVDDLATVLADACNAAHRAGYDLHDQPGGDLFTYDPAAPGGTLQVSALLLDDPERFAAAGVSGGAPGDVTNIQNLLDLRQAKLMAGGTETFEGAYRQLLSAVGRETERTSDAAAAREQLLNSLDTQYANEAGVSLDDEAVEIMRFQQVYNASIRLVKIADAMVQEMLGLIQ